MYINTITTTLSSRETNSTQLTTPCQITLRKYKMATLQEIRAKLAAAQSTTSSNGTGETGPVFPHWNMPDNSESTIRFLPDGDKSNTYFWVEKQIIKLPFPGIKGESDIRDV
jgi:hypothetical protein